MNRRISTQTGLIKARYRCCERKHGKPDTCFIMNVQFDADLIAPGGDFFCNNGARRTGRHPARRVEIDKLLALVVWGK